MVFVEVKTRRSESFGRPAMAVGPHKRRRLCRAAAAYLRRSGYPARFYRFDVIEVIGRPSRSVPPFVAGTTPSIRARQPGDAAMIVLGPS